MLIKSNIKHNVNDFISFKNVKDEPELLKNKVQEKIVESKEEIEEKLEKKSEIKENLKEEYKKENTKFNIINKKKNIKK